MLIGIVGAPNQGKSTFFNAATLAGAEIANYPFTTIEPNQGVGFVRVKCPCKEFGVECDPRQGYCKEGSRYVPVTLLDVAGLVPDAHKGKGLGNKFLDDLRQADVLVHVIDVSGGTNSSGESVGKGNFDPAETVRFLEKELDLWMHGMLSRNWARFAKQVKQESKKLSEAIATQFSGLGVKENQVIKAIEKCGVDPENPENWDDTDLLRFATEVRKISKPMVIAANKMDVDGAAENYKKLKSEFPDYIVVPISAESELALRKASSAGIVSYDPGEPDFMINDEEGLNDKQKEALLFIKEYLKKNNNTGVQQVLDSAVFDALGRIAIFPVGAKLQDSKGKTLLDVFLVPKNTTALDFAYHLHSDFGDNFVAAIDHRSKKQIGKEHELKHRDVIQLVSGK